MTDIRLSYLDDKPGFKLHFTFGPNAFFEDTELTKTYYYQVRSYCPKLAVKNKS